MTGLVFLPEGAGPHPVLLNRTPYDKDTALRHKRGQAYVKAGYVVVQVDVRGRGNSGGEFNPYFQSVRRTLDSRHPDALICDLETLRDAPRAMTVIVPENQALRGISQHFSTF